jgi:phosphate transport system protein
VRTAFHQQLDDLTVSIAELCGSAGQAMERATQALLQADLVLAEQMITDYDGMVQRAKKTEEQAMTLLALQAPVAGDLRAVLSALKNIADIDRGAGVSSPTGSFRPASSRGLPNPRRVRLPRCGAPRIRLRRSVLTR